MDDRMWESKESFQVRRLAAQNIAYGLCDLLTASGPFAAEIRNDGKEMLRTGLEQALWVLEPSQ